MNNQIINYIYKESEKLKNRQDKEDVAQEVVYIILEKGMGDNELDEGLKNYIKGIIWNYSTTLYNQFNKDTFTLTATDIPQYNVTVTYTDEREDYKELTSKIRRYVFENYYSKNKKLTKWRVFYLVLKGYDYRYIADRLKIGYKTAIEYNYQALKEIKERIA
ncbi:RNA polymerase sigma factor [Arthrospiribacter ruber]|uniref:Sigma-70 family RNA polymerase sigma factor n=1 Tax=Arthrospiribacter ruber TaxID=2487934 RepID=A0A951ME92_9BACT|nr:hypothetical protein [Arthrospiribacter ruber]MBW3469092.1 sigma-70 family RNA polymerase sigma factor [Arthrospiribacter ruber]